MMFLNLLRSTCAPYAVGFALLCCNQPLLAAGAESKPPSKDRPSSVLYKLGLEDADGKPTLVQSCAVLFTLAGSSYAMLLFSRLAALRAMAEERGARSDMTGAYDEYEAAMYDPTVEEDDVDQTAFEVADYNPTRDREALTVLAREHFGALSSTLDGCYGEKRATLLDECLEYDVLAGLKTDGTTKVCLYRGLAVGFVSFAVRPPRWQQLLASTHLVDESDCVPKMHLHHLAVDTSLHSKGCGSLLLDQALTYGKKAGVYKVTLQTTGHGEEAKRNRFYRRHGFKEGALVKTPTGSATYWAKSYVPTRTVAAKLFLSVFRRLKL